jgi:hypothetical protein
LMCLDSTESFLMGPDPILLSATATPPTSDTTSSVAAR